MVDIYYKNQKNNLSNYDTVDSKVFVSKYEGQSLQDYCYVKKYICETNHSIIKNSCDCNVLCNVAQTVIDNGICALSDLFKHNFPNVTYLTYNAKRRLMQMPIVMFPVCNQLYVMEKIQGLSYIHLSNFLTSKLTPEQAKKGMTKEDLKKLLLITSSEKERECIKYAIYKSSGITPTQARLRFGLENMATRASKVESSIAEASEIITAYDEITKLQVKALADCYGQCHESSSSDENSEDGSEAESDIAVPRDVALPSENVLPSDDFLLSILANSGFDWFAFVDKLQECGCDLSSALLDNFFVKLPTMKVKEDALDTVVQSHRAYIAAEIDFEEDNRTARYINGEIVTESDSSFEGSSSVLIEKKKVKLKRKARRLKAKALAERRFLSRKVLKKTSKLIQEFPNIGQLIENYVKDHNVGADSWRRTGVLTFDGNVHIKDKVTYKKIQKHLENVLGRTISYGTVVELCIPRNKHRRSAKRYRGLAQVTTRRARKGFNLRFNPDKHWSAAWYKGLNQLHYEDGLRVFNLNRDDAAGFRLDTLTTCKQYSTPTVNGSAVLTTRTDYVNRHRSVLQTTSYNFTKTKNTGEVCVGVVKAVPIHYKNPAQHYSDLRMLSEIEELKPVFCDCTNDEVKLIDFIRVDGAGDEGPNHESVQYWWTDWHLSNSKVATLVSTRCSGSSYLNRVELQNGCLSLGHANTFIPSTLAGSNLNSETGNIDQEKLKENLSLAITAYISRVSGCPCGDTNIKLFQGSDSTHLQEISINLDIFLKGSNKQKEVLKHQQPELYEQFQKVWKVRNNHMVRNLPSSYLFYLKCCYDKTCPHPRCQSGESVALRWFAGGPTINFLPFPIPDSLRPYGGPCETCKGFCCGHYVTKLVDITSPEDLKSIVMPPSVVLKESFSSGVTSVCPDLCKKVLLSEDEIKIWLDHLATVIQNRKRGAAKAALTRKNKRNQCSTTVNSDDEIDRTCCGVCKTECNESEAKFWICCDLCEVWYCCSCENLLSEPETDTYLCKKCCK